MLIIESWHMWQGHMLLMVNKFPNIQYSAMAV